MSEIIEKLSKGQDDYDKMVNKFYDWWDNHGQLCSSGGGGYERTFAFNAWEAQQAEITRLQKQNDVMREALIDIKDNANIVAYAKEIASEALATVKGE